MQKFKVSYLLVIACLTVFAARSLFAAPPPLPPEQAFNLSVELATDQELAMVWRMAPGYYLYRDRLKLTINTQGSDVMLGEYLWPQGILKHNAAGKVEEVYYQRLKLTVPLRHHGTGDPLLSLFIHYQGCALAGFCYAPVDKHLLVDLSRITTIPMPLTPYLSDSKIEEKS